MNTKLRISALRGRRAALGLSQHAVASQMRKSASWLSLVEHGIYEPDEWERNRLAEILHCQVSDIFPEVTP
jgi:transcriptional regulator with XRE-family HTH domain